MLRFGRAMNPSWDDAFARDRIAAAEVPLNRRAGKLSGGQRAQVALALAVAKRPRVLLLDEPLAALDPLARREFLKTLLDSATATGITVVLSSHLIGELARVCDHLVVIRDGQLRLAGELDVLLGEHHWVAGSPEATARMPAGVEVLSRSPHERHTTLLVRTREPLLNPALTTSPVDLEDLVLTYLERPPPPDDRRSPGSCKKRAHDDLDDLAPTPRPSRGRHSDPRRCSPPPCSSSGPSPETGLRALGSARRAAARADCGDALGRLHDDFHSIPPFISALIAVPLLAGMFWAAPLVSREYEAGTHRLAWTQSVSPLRWITTKITLIFARRRGCRARSRTARHAGLSTRSLQRSVAASTAPGTTSRASSRSRACCSLSRSVSPPAP